MKKLLANTIAIIFLLFSLASCKIQISEPDPTDAPEEENELEEKTGLEGTALSFFYSDPNDRIVEWEEVLEQIENKENPFILSIRQQKLYEKGHVKGAYLASWGEDLADKIDMFPLDKKIYIYCDSGQKSAQAAALLNMLGIDAVSINLGYSDGLLNTEGYDKYISRKSNELHDANEEFDNEILRFVQNYFNDITDEGSNILPANQVEMIAKWDSVVIIDIRDSSDFERGHIENSINIKFSQDMLEDLQEFTGKKIILADHNGQTSGQLTPVLRAMGYDAYSLKYGIDMGWKEYIVSNFAADFFDAYTESLAVSWADIAGMIDNEENPFILCIQKESEYKKEHIKGAYLATWGEALAEKMNMLPDDKKIYVYSDNGQTANQAAILMNMLGLDAFSIKGGFESINGEEDYSKYTETASNELIDSKPNFNPFLLISVQEYLANSIDKNNYIITAENVENEIENNQFIVVDIRAAKTFKSGHVEGAVNIPFGEDMQNSFSKLTSKKLIITDKNGQISTQIVAILRQLGYDAFALDSGMEAWTH